MNRSLSLTLGDIMEFTVQYVIYLRASDHVFSISGSLKHLGRYIADKSCSETICFVQGHSDKSFPLEYLTSVYKIPKRLNKEM